MTRLTIPDWPADPAMEVGMPVYSTVLQRVLVDHFDRPVTMSRPAFGRGLVFDLGATREDVEEAAALYLDPIGLRWHVSHVTSLLAVGA